MEDSTLLTASNEIDTSKVEDATILSESQSPRRSEALELDKQIQNLEGKSALYAIPI